jgi:glycosyltransferase involved in cell wall biosynthesis
MKILHVNAKLAWAGGIEIYLLSLLSELVALGHRPHVVYTDGDSALWPESDRLPEMEEVGKSAASRGYRTGKRLFARIRPNVIHLHNIHNIGVVRACLETAPTVVTGHDYRYLCPASTFYFRRTEEICQRRCGPGCFTTTLTKRCMSLRPRYAWDYFRRVRWFARNLPRFASVIAPSESARQRFLQVGMPADRTTTLPYFCPTEPLIRPRPEPDRPTILFMGRIRPNKGYRYFIEALGQLPASVRGILVGDLTPNREEELRRLAAQAGCGQRLELRPWAGRDAVEQMYRQASIFVFPSVWAETLGIVGLEALACGVPVVASDVGGVREWLREGETGLLVPPKDAGALARAVRELLSPEDRRRRLGQNGICLIRERFCLKAHLSKLETIYNNL